MTNHTSHRKSVVFLFALCLLALLSLTVPARNAPAQDSSWVTQTNIYQVFVEKFGGTLKGVESHLDHLKYLGVKTIWLMPIFESMSDHGYDTTNYYAIRSNYGTIDDLRDLVQAAEKKGMRVILDLVMNHVGSEHPWFSSADSAERKDHWFVWSAIDQGWNKPWGGRSGPGETWFGDPQAQYDRDGNGNPHDDDYFYAVFAPTMPDFNFNNSTSRNELIDEFEKIMRFWIEKTGVSGFRCDAARYFVENGPHSDDRKDEPETHQIWKTLRSRLQAIDPEAILLAEAPTETYEQMRGYYGEGDEFHTAFHFKYQGVLMDTLRSERRPGNLLTDLYAIQSHLPIGTQDTIFLSNHDKFAGDRVASQLGGNIAKMKSVASLYLLLSGNPAIYYGEEIGMHGKDSDSDLRRPMDFASAAAQKSDSSSLFNHYTRLLRLRNKYDSLRGGITYFAPSFDGAWDCMTCESNRMAIVREYFGEKILVIHNFTGSNLNVHVDLSKSASGLDIADGTNVHALMGGGSYPEVSSSNRSFYPLGTLFGYTTKVLFLGDISPYLTDGRFLSYENALIENQGETIPIHFTCQEGHTIHGRSVYVVGDADEIGGAWNTKHAVKLDPTHYPTWTGTIDLPKSSSIEWKCIIRDENAPFHVHKWGPDPNNVVNTPATGSHTAMGTL
jgi:alpha-amylase